MSFLKTIETFTAWAEENSYILDTYDDHAGCTQIQFRNTASGELIYFCFYKHFPGRKLVTYGTALPPEIDRSIFEDDPNLHWATVDYFRMSRCGLCNRSILFEIWCNSCHQKRLSRRAGTWWLMVAPYVLSNKDAVGYIARVFALLAAGM